jgi:hypothetical protein
MGIVFPCAAAHAAQDFQDWNKVDGLHGVIASGLPGSTPPCQYPRNGKNSPTAEQLASQIALNVQGPSWGVTSLQVATGLPVIYTDFYPINADGMNYATDPFGLINQAPQDNQEVVDYFEALMRVLGQQPTTGGFFFFAVYLPGGTLRQDPLNQPELMNAVANWWGGDTAYFAPCMAPDPPGVLFQENFDEACPVQKQPFQVVRDWAVISEPQAPQNHLLQGDGNGYAVIGPSSSSWADYTARMRIKIVQGVQTVVIVRFRARFDLGPGQNYSARFGGGQLWLYKGDQVVASYVVSGGTQLGRWHQLEITAVGPKITIKLDGTPVIQYTDQNAPLLNGNVSLNVFDGGTGQGLVYFDDIQIDAVGR